MNTNKLIQQKKKKQIPTTPSEFHLAFFDTKGGEIHGM